MRDYVWRETMLKAFGVDGTATSPDLLNKYIEDIGNTRPDLLQALPQYAYGLAKYMAAKGNGIRIPSIRPFGGKVTEEIKNSLAPARLRSITQPKFLSIDFQKICKNLYQC